MKEYLYYNSINDKVIFHTLDELSIKFLNLHNKNYIEIYGDIKIISEFIIEMKKDNFIILDHNNEVIYFFIKTKEINNIIKYNQYDKYYSKIIREIRKNKLKIILKYEI